MNHLVLSRKYRPQRFEDLVGQEAVAQTLRNAIASGRIGHAYLFIGPRGTGKTTTARIFAKALNCESGPTATPCGTCASCLGIASGNDLDVVEMDAASNNSVEDVRALRDSVGYRPARSRFRVWIVDEVHMLSVPAFNAFLKTLEEPPPQAKFLFCTTEAHKLPETFTSRVQRLEFRRIEEPRMADRLRSLVAREGLGVEDGVCERIAEGALGGLRDAESLLEQLLSCAEGGRVTHADLDAVSGRAGASEVEALFEALLEGDPSRALEAAGACLQGGAKPDVVLDQVVDGFRALLPAAARQRARAGAAGASPSAPPPLAPQTPAPQPPGVAGAGASAALAGGAALESRAAAFGLARILRSVDLLLEKRRALRDGADARLVVEIACVELASLPSARDLERLLESLEADVRRGAASAPAGAMPRAPVPLAGAPVPLAGAPRGAVGDAGGVRSQGGPGVTASPYGAAVPPRPAAFPGATPAAEGASPAAVAAAAGGCAVKSVTSGGGLGAPATVPADEVVARWPEIVQAGVRRSRRLASCLGKARLVGVVGDVALLHIPETESIARGVLRDREATDAFREAAREVLGVGLRPALDEGGPKPTGSGPAGFAPSGSVPASSRGGAAGTPSSGPVPGAAPPAGSMPPAASGGEPSRAGASAVGGAPVGSAPSAGSSPPSRPPVSTGERLDDVRARPEVKAVLDAFGARVLAIQRIEPPPTPAPPPGGEGGDAPSEPASSGATSHDTQGAA